MNISLFVSKICNTHSGTALALLDCGSLSFEVKIWLLLFTRPPAAKVVVRHEAAFIIDNVSTHLCSRQ